MTPLTAKEIHDIAGTLEDGKFRMFDYELKAKSETRLGFLGDHYTLSCSTLKGELTRCRMLFVKTFPAQQLMEEDFLGKTGIFKRETEVYKTLLARMLNMSPLKFCPKYHFSKDNVLVLEELSETDFVAYDSTAAGLLDEHHLTQVLSTLASLHATSIALEESNSSQPLDKTYPDLFEELIYSEENRGSPTMRWLMKNIQDLRTGVDHLPQYTTQQKQIIQQRLAERLKVVYPLSKPSAKYRNVLVHGDVWANNILFKYAQDKVATDVRLVDYQFVRYAPPAHDVMHLLYLTTKKQFRSAHEQQLILHYYTQLGKHLDHFGLKLEPLFPWQSFQESCEVYRELAVAQSLLAMNYIKAPPRTVPKCSSPQEYDQFIDRHRKEFMEKCFQHSDYTDRVIELFLEFIDNYVLKEF